VPAVAISFSVAAMLVGVLLNYLAPAQVFIWITSVSTIGGIWTWGMIMWTHLKWRRAVAEKRQQPVSFQMPGAPYVNWLVLAFLAMVTVFLSFDADTRVALYVAPLWAAALWIGYRFANRQPAASTSPN
jgi:AAT family amino acid transporter/D-serine/D-alanine/glycine transporter